MSPRAWAAFAAMSTIWGIPYLFIKVAVDDGIPPAFLAWVRVSLAAAVLLALAIRAGALPSLRGKGRILLAYAVVEITLPFPLIAAGEQHVASSLAAIIIASVPLIIALLAIRFDHAERATGTRLVGLVIGLVGVVALVGIEVAGNPDELLGAGMIMLAAVGYAAGPMILKRHMADLDPRATMGVTLAIAAILLTPAAAIAPPSQAPSTEAILSLLILGLVCTALAFVIFSNLIVEIGPGRALVITYINPVVAVALGVTVLGERPGASAIAGLLLILAGSWLSTDGRLPPGLAERLRGRLRPRSSPTIAEHDLLHAHNARL
jgi:drug/metabolite transporter (DMT)-like permease